MTRHERFLEKLAEMAREHEEKPRPAEWVKSRLRWEDWETLRPEAVDFAKEEIGRRKWRGSRGGVLPEGYDAESVANQVIKEMLEGKCRLAVGFTREKVVNELKRLVGQRVRLLHRLREAKGVRSEWDGMDEGEEESVLERVPAESEGVDETVCGREEELWRTRVIEDFGKLLQPEPELRAIFGCLCAGMNESEEIAGHLGVDKCEVVKGRKRLVRRAGEFERRMFSKRRKGARWRRQDEDWSGRNVKCP